MAAPRNRFSIPSATLPLGGEFSAPTYQRWQQEVEKVVRAWGLLTEDEPTPEAVEELLATATYDGITVHPLYTQDAPPRGYPGSVPFVRGSQPSQGWDVRQRYMNPDAAVTNQEILADLKAGTASLWLRMGRSGLRPNDLAEALHDVHLDSVSLVLDAGDEFESAATALLDLAQRQGVADHALRGNLGADPLTVHARTGQQPEPPGVIELVRRRADRYPGLRPITVDGTPYHDAGGSDAEELGCSLAAGTTYLRWLTEAGVDVETAVRSLEFRYAAHVDQFATITKLRAARKLWERVTRECGVPANCRGQLQHAVTSSAMLTQRDPAVNILRNTIAAFAAGIGGARAVTVLPFDAALGLPTPLSRRIARNTQALLLDESHLARVVDAAGGSWHVEARTDALAHQAWKWFQDIEASGGLSHALDSGLIADRLEKTWQRRHEAIAVRADPITGVSEFPEINEEPMRRVPAPEEPSGGLARHRYAEAFEQFRDASDAYTVEAGFRPQVFLATLGPLADYHSRAEFARNLFAAGGVETPEAGPTDSPEEVVRAFQNERTSLVCLCSSDAVYARRASETARALSGNGASRVFLISDSDRELSNVDRVVYPGIDVLEVLADVHREWGVRH